MSSLQVDSQKKMRKRVKKTRIRMQRRKKNNTKYIVYFAIFILVTAIIITLRSFLYLKAANTEDYQKQLAQQLSYNNNIRPIIGKPSFQLQQANLVNIKFTTINKPHKTIFSLENIMVKYHLFSSLLGSWRGDTIYAEKGQATVDLTNSWWNKNGSKEKANPIQHTFNSLQVENFQLNFTAHNKQDPFAEFKKSQLLLYMQDGPRPYLRHLSLEQGQLQSPWGKFLLKKFSVDKFTKKVAIKMFLPDNDTNEQQFIALQCKRDSENSTKNTLNMAVKLHQVNRKIFHQKYLNSPLFYIFKGILSTDNSSKNNIIFHLNQQKKYRLSLNLVGKNMQFLNLPCLQFILFGQAGHYQKFALKNATCIQNENKALTLSDLQLDNDFITIKGTLQVDSKQQISGNIKIGIHKKQMAILYSRHDKEQPNSFPFFSWFDIKVSGSLQNPQDNFESVFQAIK